MAIIRYKNIYDMTDDEILIALCDIALRQFDYDNRRFNGIPPTEEELEQMRIDDELSEQNKQKRIRRGKQLPNNILGSAIRGFARLAEGLGKAGMKRN